MKKLIFLISIFLANVIYASFPVNNISNNHYNHSESATHTQFIEGEEVIWSIFILWLLPIVILFFKSTKTDDIKKKKKLSKIIRYLLFIPLALFVILLIFLFILLLNWEPIRFSYSN